ncbi:MAG: glycine cleavage system aminomethyltransferase GcvT [Armatimonadota bacterium]
METKNLKKTALYEKHTALGAKMIEFGDFLMPVEYSGILNEHRVTREKAGIFDLSHMGEIIVKGSGAFSLVQRLTTNDISKLSEGQILYTPLCRDDGGILDDILVYNRGSYYFLVVNASNMQKIYNWICMHKEADAEIENASDRLSLIAVQGPVSENILQKIIDIDLSKLKYYNCADVKIGEIDVLISRTGYTGEDGFEVYVDNDKSPAVWDLITDAGAGYNMEPVGLGARDTLRLEARYCLYGNDINEEVNPVEAGLNWVVKLDKGDFIGKQALENFKRQRYLVGFKMLDKGIPRKGYDIYDEIEKIGEVTSGTFSPSLNQSIGLGYVNKTKKDPGSIINIKVRDRLLKAEVIKGPFVKGSIKINK